MKSTHSAIPQTHGQIFPPELIKSAQHGVTSALVECRKLKRLLRPPFTQEEVAEIIRLIRLDIPPDSPMHDSEIMPGLRALAEKRKQVKPKLRSSR